MAARNAFEDEEDEVRVMLSTEVSSRGNFSAHN